MFAFVFLLAFTLSNFWGADHAARAATRSQYIDFSRAASQASWLSPGQGREEILNGLAAYSATVINAIEPAFRQADAVEVYVLQRDAAIGLESSVRAASQAGASKNPAWTHITDSISAVANDGDNRLLAMPTGNIASAVLMLVAFLGPMNLVLTAVYVPAPLSTNLTLVGIMAAITAVLLFVVVEAANPYIGSAAILDSLALPG